MRNEALSGPIPKRSACVEASRLPPSVKLNGTSSVTIWCWKPGRTVISEPTAVKKPEDTNGPNSWASSEINGPHVASDPPPGPKPKFQCVMAPLRWLEQHYPVSPNVA